MIPLGAAPIIEHRKNGMKPEQIIVSAVGRIYADCPVVFADTAGCDWFWAQGLDVTVIVEPGKGGDVVRAVAGVAANCSLYDRKAKRGAHAIPMWSEKHLGACLGDLDGDIPSHARRWFPEWRHPEKWDLKIKLVPWWPIENEGMAWLN